MQIEVGKIPYGEIFTMFGDEFVVLDHIDSGVLSIRKDIWTEAPFDEDGNNDFSKASILEELTSYFEALKENGATDSCCKIMQVDLKATDGTRDYGYHQLMTILLTLEQYGKYKDIIPFVDGVWWLSTPWRTPWPRSPYTYSSAFAWLIYPQGGSNSGNCSIDFGIRPVLNFVSSLLVSWDNTGNENEASKDAENARRNEITESYTKYLENWSGEYGETPMSFGEWEEDYDF